MKKKKITHKDRVAKVKEYASKNKLFTIIAIIISLFLIMRLFAGYNQNSEKPIEENYPTTGEILSEKTEEKEPYKVPPFHVGMVDIVILAIGGGFCGIMIFRERRKGGLNKK